MVKNLYKILKAEDQYNSIMAINVHFPTGCGIPFPHAYSLIGAFSMLDKQNNTFNMIIVRDPWGITKVNQSWNRNDKRWTDDLVA